MEYLIPDGQMASDNEAANAARQRLRDALRRGERVTVSQDGELQTENQRDPDRPAIEIPKGKLASG